MSECSGRKCKHPDHDHNRLALPNTDDLGAIWEGLLSHRRLRPERGLPMSEGVTRKNPDQLPPGHPLSRELDKKLSGMNRAARRALMREAKRRVRKGRDG